MTYEQEIDYLKKELKIKTEQLEEIHDLFRSDSNKEFAEISEPYNVLNKILTILETSYIMGVKKL